MKKIYTLASTLLLSTIAYSQTTNDVQNLKTQKEPYSAKKNTSLLKNSKTNLKTSAAGPVAGRFDPGFAVLMFNQEADMTNGVNSADVGTYLAPVFMDSTVQSAFTSGTSHIGTHKQGMVFDPQSVVFDPSNDPLFGNNDTWYLDTVWIGGVYNRTSAPTVVDTLLVEITYADTTLTTAFNRISYSAAAAPLNEFGSFLLPRFAKNTAHGNTCFITAPTANYKKIKVPLTEADSAVINQTGYMPVVVSGTTGLALTGKNKVSVMYTFIPGQATTFGDVVFAAGTMSPTAGQNGFAGVQYAQKSPALTNLASIQKYFDDPLKGKNGAADISSAQRYGLTSTTSPFATTAIPGIYASYWMDFSIHGNSTVGIDELEIEGASLGQNVPNPFTSESMVSYQLTKDASNASFTVTDVMGRVISSEKVASNIGKHSVKLGAYAAGVYYYTLTVDGKSASKKMIVQ